MENGLTTLKCFSGRYSMNLKENAGLLGTSTSWICTIAQTNEIFQLAMLILSIVSTLFTIAYTIYKWYNKAKQDGKITPEEIKELGDDLQECLKDKEEK